MIPRPRPRRYSTRGLRLLAIAAAVLLPVTAPAQNPPAAPAQDVPPANPRDVSSVNAIITTLYSVISGPAGHARDWDRFRSLFLPDARLVAVGVGANGAVRHRPMTAVQYVTAVGPAVERSGFFEREIHRTTDGFGHVVHAFSTYESRRKADDAEPYVRGINSIQLFSDERRWWIVSIIWDSERDGNPIPEKYVPS